MSTIKVNTITAYSGSTITITSALSLSSTLAVTGAATFTALVTGTTGFSGALNGTVGATTPAAGSFTTLAASSTFTLSGTAANLALGSNFISNGGTDAGLSFDSSNHATLSANLKVTGAFGCNAATAQTAFASGGALAAYGAGANGFDSGANASALHALVVAIRAALVANGIMS